jgi:copper chaperone CopZ
MKYTILSAAVVAAAAVFMIGCNPNKQGEASNTQPAAQPQVVKTVIDLPTMKCKNCAQTITAAVKTLDGVQDVKVDVDTKKAEVQYISTKLDEKKIETTISNAGYDANSMKRNDTAYSQLSPCCQ